MAKRGGGSIDRVPVDESRHETLVETLFRAVRWGDGKPLIDPATKAKHPKKLVIRHDDQTTNAWLYVWPLDCEDRRPEPLTRYRLQRHTASFPRFVLNPDGPTLLLGYFKESDCFVAFDLLRVAGKRAKNAKKLSPTNVWVTRSVLHSAVETGISFQLRSGDQFIEDVERPVPSVDDFVVVFSPENFLTVLLNCESWFEDGQDETVARMMHCVPTSPSSLFFETFTPDKQRQSKAITIWQKLRDAAFPKRIRRAYNNTCAVTGIQLNLPIAAHICPVASGLDNDTVSNGIALSPTIHEALDDGLIYLAYRDDGRLFLRPNERLLYDFEYRGLHAEQELILQHVGEIRPSRLPADREEWPDPEMIRLGNDWRDIFGS